MVLDEVHAFICTFGNEEEESQMYVTNLDNILFNDIQKLIFFFTKRNYTSISI